MLESSIDLLYKNYNNQFKNDIIIFHEGDFWEEDQKKIKRNRKEIKFIEISKYFNPPVFINKKTLSKEWNLPQFGWGHRNMCRWYSCLIHPFLIKMGYDWYMRMDDDSFIHSEIKYDLFDYMIEHKYKYGYRANIKESSSASVGFADMTLSYLLCKKIKSKFFLESFLTDGSWNRNGYYNNFLISDLHFWMKKEVRDYLNFIDRTGFIYYNRWNDAIIQTAAVQIFLEKNQIYKFTDWTYEHSTFNKNKELSWGGMCIGNLDNFKSKYIVEFKEKAGILTKHIW